MVDLNCKNIHPSWQPLVTIALSTVAKHYLTQLQNRNNWLPGPNKIFNAFSQPLEQTRYILFGESPYPRSQSANGYAFWDEAVHDIWSDTGFSKAVNRATSLRNFLKMLLVAENSLTIADTAQHAIAKIDKSNFITELEQLFEHLLQKGFLLLNASLVLNNNNVQHDARHWRPFMQKLLTELVKRKLQPTLLLFGKIAQIIHAFPEAKTFPQLIAEHPYNISFISNQEIIDFFRPLHLLVC